MDTRRIATPAGWLFVATFVTSIPARSSWKDREARAKPRAKLGNDTQETAVIPLTAIELRAPALGGGSTPDHPTPREGGK